MKLDLKIKAVTEFTYKDFIISVFDSECRGHRDREAWIRHKDYAFAMLMLGSDPQQTTFEQFLDLVYFNLPLYIADYRDYFMMEVVE